VKKQLSDLAFLSKETNMPAQPERWFTPCRITGGLPVGALCPTGGSPYSMYIYGLTQHEHFKCDHTDFS